MISVAALASWGLATGQASAQAGGDIVGRAEIFGGSARDGRPLGGEETGSSVGVLPSASLAVGSARLQVDGMAADHLDSSIFALAGQLTTQPQNNMTWGVYGSYARHDVAGDLSVYRIGGQANYQGETVTVSVVAGYENVDDAVVAVGAVPGFTVADTYGRQGFFSMADLTYYPSANWALLAGHRFIGGRHAGAVGVERLFAGETSNLSVFAEARVGEDDYAAAWLGLRFRFGRGGGSLRDRDRASGLQNRLKDELFSLSNTRTRALTAIPVVTPPVIVPPVIVPPVVVPPVVVPPPVVPPVVVPAPQCNCGPCYPAG